MISSFYSPTYLYTKVTTIDIISQEKVSSLLRISSDFKQLHEIIVLAVNVTADSDGRIHLEEIGLLSQYLGALVDNIQRLLLRQAAFAVKVLLQESKVRLLGVFGIIELLVRRLLECRCLYICFF